MSKSISLVNSGYQMSSENSCCDLGSSGLLILPVPRKKIHCILPSSPWLADSKTNIPLGVLYIAGLLRDQGHEVVVTSMLDKRYEGNIHLQTLSWTATFICLVSVLLSSGRHLSLLLIFGIVLLTLSWSLEVLIPLMNRLRRRMPADSSSIITKEC